MKVIFAQGPRGPGPTVTRKTCAGSRTSPTKAFKSSRVTPSTAAGRPERASAPGPRASKRPIIRSRGDFASVARRRRARAIVRVASISSSVTPPARRAERARSSASTASAGFGPSRLEISNEDPGTLRPGQVGVHAVGQPSSALSAHRREPGPLPSRVSRRYTLGPWPRDRSEAGQRPARRTSASFSCSS